MRVSSHSPRHQPHASKQEETNNPDSGGTNGATCGQHWTANSTYDGNPGVGQQMSALSVIQCMLLNSASPLLTNTTGGTSEGDPSAGTSPQANSDPATILPATTGDKAGAGIVTVILLVSILGGVGFMVTGN